MLPNFVFLLLKDLHNFLSYCWMRKPWQLSLDEMGHRIDDLERNIADLMAQAGIEEKWNNGLSYSVTHCRAPPRSCIHSTFVGYVIYSDDCHVAFLWEFLFVAKRVAAFTDHRLIINVNRLLVSVTEMKQFMPSVEVSCRSGRLSVL